MANEFIFKGIGLPPLISKSLKYLPNCLNPSSIKVGRNSPENNSNSSFMIFYAVKPTGKQDKK